MGGSVLSNCLQCRRPMRCRFNPWLGKTPFKRKCQLIPVFSLGQWDTPMDRGAWRPTFHKVAKSWTRLNYITLTILTQKYTHTHTHTHTHTPSMAWAKQPIWSLSSDTQIRSDQISRSVASDSLRPHESQHASPPCPPPTPGVHSDSRPLGQWCNPAISSSVVPFSSCPQSLPAWVFSNESTLRMRWPKYCSFSFSIIPSKEIPGLISYRMDWLDLLAVQVTLHG